MNEKYTDFLKSALSAFPNSKLCENRSLITTHAAQV